jgi:hypothetical protein
MTSEICRKTALVLMILWAGWWTFFALAVGVSEAAQPWQIGPYPLMAAGIFLASVFVGWQYRLFRSVRQPVVHSRAGHQTR